MKLINNALTSLMVRILSLRDEPEEGQTLVEYALIIALVSIVLVAALGLLATGIGDIFGKITNTLNNAVP